VQAGVGGAQGRSVGRVQRGAGGGTLRAGHVAHCALPRRCVRRAQRRAAACVTLRALRFGSGATGR